MTQNNANLDIKTGFKSYNNDLAIEKAINDHCVQYDISGFELVTNAFLLMRRQHLKRFLLHTELFQKTLNIPGDIVELGVFRGLGLMTWANLLECYCIGDRTKRVLGFDNWTGFTDIAPEDGAQNSNSGKVVGGFDPKNYAEELNNVIEIFNADRFVPWKERVKLFDGNIEETIPSFVKDNPGVRLSLIHFDVDLYAPTKIGLECLWDRLSRGGIMVFDEYSIPDWPGETLAVDQFLSDKPELKLETCPWTNSPAAWLIKP